MPTIGEDIMAAAAAYPDRLAIVYIDGTQVTYADLPKVLPNLATIPFYTTGTTSGRKLVLITDDQLRQRIARFDHPAELGASERLLVPMDVRSSGWLTRVAYALSKGRTIYGIGQEPADPAKVWALATQHDCDGICAWQKVGSPGVIAGMIAGIDKLSNGHRFKNVYASGGPLAADDYAALHQLGDNVFVHYGATEVGPIAAGLYDDIKDIPNCVGDVMPDVTVEIDAGRIKIKSDSAASMYVDDMAMSSKRFVDGWFFPGDLGAIDAGTGKLIVTGRDPNA